MAKSNIQSMLDACHKSLRNNEYNLRKIKGVTLTRSDVETVILYGETIRHYGTYVGELMTPHGAVAELLGKFGVL